MTDADADLIRETFAQLHRRKAETAALFYARLFTIAPEVRPLFKGDMAAQGEKLMETLTVVVAMLRDPQGMHLLLSKLGKGHQRYGVRDDHYDSVQQALRETLRDMLGTDLTVTAERAWMAVYDDIAGVMKAAARTV
jgi:nitric oxide dioxygenase